MSNEKFQTVSFDGNAEDLSVEQFGEQLNNLNKTFKEFTSSS